MQVYNPLGASFVVMETTEKNEIRAYVPDALAAPQVWTERAQHQHHTQVQPELMSLLLEVNGGK